MPGRREGKVYIGEVIKPHGVRGELKLLEGFGSSGTWRKAPEVFIGTSLKDLEYFRVSSIRGKGRFIILALEGVETVEKANQLRGKKLFVDRQRLPELEEDVYYINDLLGMKVFDIDGKFLGTLVEIFDNGVHEIYMVKDASQEILIPIVDGVVVEVDSESGRMVVNLPAGLNDLPQ